MAAKLAPYYQFLVARNYNRSAFALAVGDFSIFAGWGYVKTVTTVSSTVMLIRKPKQSGSGKNDLTLSR